jgi:hypothetical protein
MAPICAGVAGAPGTQRQPPDLQLHTCRLKHAASAPGTQHKSPDLQAHACRLKHAAAGVTRVTCKRGVPLLIS